MGKDRHGASAADIIMKVPAGTQIVEGFDGDREALRILLAARQEITTARTAIARYEARDSVTAMKEDGRIASFPLQRIGRVFAPKFFKSEGA